MPVVQTSPPPDQVSKLDAAVQVVLGAVRVLFVDDNTLNCRIGYRMLSELGAAVECATSGEEALALAESTEFDVIVLDCAMPGMSGFDVAERLRGPGRKNALTPIVAVTAMDAEGIRQRAHRAGMGQVICKPLSRESVLAALNCG